MLPHYFETEINSISYFTFVLTAAAVGVESDIILEISVDYGVSLDRSQVTANAWARKQGGTVKFFIQTVHVPLGDEEPERILAALNGNDGFLSALAQLIAMLERQ